MILYVNIFPRLLFSVLGECVRVCESFFVLQPVQVAVAVAVAAIIVLLSCCFDLTISNSSVRVCVCVCMFFVSQANYLLRFEAVCCVFLVMKTFSLLLLFLHFLPPFWFACSCAHLRVFAQYALAHVMKDYTHSRPLKSMRARMLEL